MSPPLRFQILSDLHLETPLSSPSYDKLTIPISAPNLFLLGDTGLTTHPQLFTFLTGLLTTYPNLQIYYVLGNHEAYHTTLDLSISTLSDFETQCTKNHNGRFHFLRRTRVDLSPTLTLLGCTLWTRIPPSSIPPCASLLTDFSDRNGIWDRSIEQHNLDHSTDLTWLNSTVAHISSTEPEREIVVLTHHSPTIDPRANSARHRGSSTNCGFRTDLSGEVCWKSGRVKMWAYGHTHFSCQFREGGEEGMLVVSNQMGYNKNKDVEVVVVEAGSAGRNERWRVVVGERWRRGERSKRVRRLRMGLEARRVERMKMGRSLRWEREAEMRKRTCVNSRMVEKERKMPPNCQQIQVTVISQRSRNPSNGEQPQRSSKGYCINHNTIGKSILNYDYFIETRVYVQFPMRIPLPQAPIHHISTSPCRWTTAL
jgi:hypothetical protein